MSDTHAKASRGAQSDSSARGARGRFQPGQSGNPAGKKPGTLNHATRLKAALADGDFEAAARQLVEKVHEGNVPAIRLLIDRLDPKPRGRPVAIDVPLDGTPVERFAAVSRAMCAGEISPQEAETMVRVLRAEDEARERAAQAEADAAYKRWYTDFQKRFLELFPMQWDDMPPRYPKGHPFYEETASAPDEDLHSACIAGPDATPEVARDAELLQRACIVPQGDANAALMLIERRLALKRARALAA